jgi:hypothetical protein
VACVDLLRQVHAVGLGHDDVGEQEIPRAGERPSVASRACDVDVVSLFAQHPCQEVAYDFLVVDDEDPLCTADWDRVDGQRLRRHCMCDGQPDGERRAGAGLRAHLDRAAALCDDPVDRRQAEAGAGADVLRREEGLEEAEASLFVHPRTVVHYLEHDLFAVVAGRNRQPSASRHRVAGVDCEVEEHLSDLTRIGCDRMEVRVELERDLDFFADQTSQHRFHLVHAIVEVDDARLQHLAAAEGE